MGRYFLFTIFCSQFLFSQNILKDDFIHYTKRHTIQVCKLQKRDRYTFFYTANDKMCRLKKNGVSIPLFDTRFKVSKPKIKMYKCAAWIKERYKECKMQNMKHVASVAMSFGRLPKTNFLLAFNPTYFANKAFLEVDCSK